MAWLVMTVCTMLWMKPVTELVTCGPNVVSSELIRGRPLACVSVAAWLMIPFRLSWLVISFVILSVRTFWMAGSWISGSTVATQRPVSETWLPAHTPSTATGASRQPRTMSTMDTGVRQLKRCRRAGPSPWPRSLALSARRRSSSARSSGLSSWPSVAGPDSPLTAGTGTSRTMLSHETHSGSARAFVGSPAAGDRGRNQHLGWSSRVLPVLGRPVLHPLGQRALTSPSAESQKTPAIEFFDPGHVAAAGPLGEPPEESVQARIGAGRIALDGLESTQPASAQGHDAMLTPRRPGR